MKIELRPSLKVVQQIASIERFAGRWERLSQSGAVANDALADHALAEGARAAISLDPTSPISLLAQVEVERELGDRHEAVHRLAPGNAQKTPLNFLIEAFSEQEELSVESILRLFTRVTEGVLSSDERKFRNTPLLFVTPGMGPQADNEVVFPVVSPFLVEQRLQDLIEWTNRELEEGAVHPLLVIGTFHLLFLQVHPLPTANHRIALLITSQLLDEHGYDFVRYSSFIPVIAQRTKQYFAALRQAEKTAGSTWSTLNIWLEFFLDTLIHASDELTVESERLVTSSSLTSVQRRIIDVVKTIGSVTRERIINETGINISTVKYNLAVLATKGHLKREGGGRTTSYRVL